MIMSAVREKCSNTNRVSVLVLGHLLYDLRKRCFTPSLNMVHVRTGDYRDQLPPTMEEVAAYYAPVVKDGQWTFGLLEMWGHRARVAKSAVHVPCWEAFSWNPFKWRGLCFGR